MKKATLLLLCLYTALAAQSQKDVPAFGKITMEDMLLKSCPFEPDANAMKLFEIQEVQVDVAGYSGLRMKTEKRVRIKIFSDKGFIHGSIKIPYYSKRGVSKIKDLKGIVYNLDASGKIVSHKLDQDDFFKNKLIDNLKEVNFTFPGLVAGSVIEYSYTKIETNITQPDTWYIQGELPVAYTIQKFDLPALFLIHGKPSGFDTLEVGKKDKKSTSTRLREYYFRNNVPSFKEEAFMSSTSDNLQKIVFLIRPFSFSSMHFFGRPEDSWRETGWELMKFPLFGGQLKTSIPGTEKIIDSSKKISDKVDRIHFIYQAVKSQMKMVEEQTLFPDKIEEAWSRRAGNSAEINLILINLLQKADLKAFPLLISTRNNGSVNTGFPSLGQLNGVDAYVIEGKTSYILDASLPFQSILNPPANILNRKAFIVGEGHMRWVTINDHRPLLKKGITILGELTEKGILEGTASIQYFDYARSIRLDTTAEEESNKFFDNKTVGLSITSVKTANEEDYKEPLFETVDFNYTVPKTEDFYFLKPDFLFPIKSNPFTSVKRVTDIDFGCNQEMVSTMVIDLPAAFEVNHLPTNINLIAADTSFSFKRKFGYENGKLMMSEIFEINSPVFDKSSYQGIYEFFNKMYAQLKEEVVIKKKK